MKNILHVVFNDQVVLEFDRNKTIPEEHRQYLDNMDARMDEGIEFENKLKEAPNPLQKAQFVANHMLNGLINQDSNQSIAMCTYLGDRIPDLKQIICSGNDDDKGIKIEFVYDEDHQEPPQEQVIQFFDPKKLTKH